MLTRLLLLATAGAVGTLARFGISSLVNKYSSPSYPLGTLAVNLTGCFLAGLLWTLIQNRVDFPAGMKDVALIGFMGAFTTFSAFILETGELCRSSAWGHAAVNLLSANIFGLIALFFGISTGKHFQ